MVVERTDKKEDNFLEKAVDISVNQNPTRPVVFPEKKLTGKSA